MNAEARVFKSKSELPPNFIDQLKNSPVPKNILFVKPNHFAMDDVLNPHGFTASGEKLVVNKDIAMNQWDDLIKEYQKLDVKTHILDGVPQLPDMCFCANQTFPYLDSQGQKRLVKSNMRNNVRHKEVEHVAKKLESLGYKSDTLAERSEETLFEGMGDALFLWGKSLILGGYGHRTSEAMYQKIAKLTQTPVIALKLKNPRFYHLDTALSIIGPGAAIACREAFDDEGWELIKTCFPKLIVVSQKEADSPNFACNAHCPDGKHVILQKGCIETEKSLRQVGFEPVPVETSEFIKSGGSVFCLKLMFY